MEEYDKMSNGKHERADECSMDHSKYKDEKLKLQAVVSDLTQVNRRWQRYNIDMQAYIKKLQKTIGDQQEQINNMADLTAGELNLSNKHDPERDKVCLKCLPLIKSQQERIMYLQEQLYKRVDERKETDQNTDLLDLQLKLRQAYIHIDHINKIKLSKGILKSNSNKRASAFSPTRVVKPFSVDYHTHYECDSSSFEDLSYTLKGIDIDKENLMPPSTSQVEGSSLTFNSDTSSEEEAELFFIKEETPTMNSEYQPYNIVRSSNNSIDVNNKMEDLKTIVNEINKPSFVLPVINPPNICFSDKNIIDNEWDLSDKYNTFNLSDINLGDITCPQCLTVFPPGSDNAYKDHIESCQLL